MAVSRKACPECNSRDNVAVYEDGGEHCFTPGCTYHVHGEGRPSGPPKPRRVTPMEMMGQIVALKDRGLSEKTCKKFGVTADFSSDGKVANHWYPYHNKLTGDMTACKKRVCKTKDMPWSGNRQDIGLFGQQLCRGKGKYITITEGEIDAMSVSEMFNNKWDVVSLLNGADGAIRDVKDNLEFLEGYDSVVLCFDNDEAGKRAVDAVKDIFSPGKVKVVQFPADAKDANDMWRRGRGQEFVKCWWDAKPYQPAGLVMVNDTWEELLKYKNTPSVPYPWEGLNRILQGMRKREVVVWAAETGIGKSQTMREIQNHIVEVTDERVGCLMLEESIAKTTLGWMSFMAGRPLHKELGQIPEEELRAYWEQATRENRFVLLDHNGWNNDFDILKARVRYMAKTMDCGYIVLDHLHYALSSVQGSSGDWAGIDELMTEIVQLAQSCNVGIHLVSHVSEGRSLRGSKGISKLADAVIFLERDKHNEDPEIANTTAVVVDKNRWAGDVGTACYLRYDPHTGRMTECDKPAATPEEF